MPPAESRVRPARAHGAVASELSSAPLATPPPAGGPWPDMASVHAALLEPSGSSSDLVALGAPLPAPDAQPY
eukprot:4338623-Alexandrium_andersonii.AAC.1